MFKRIRKETAEDTDAGASLQTPFGKSLEMLTPDDIAPPVSKKKPDAAQRRAQLLRLLLVAVSLTVFAVCLVNFISKLVSYRESADIYTRLEEEFNRDATEGSLLPYMKKSNRTPALTVLGASRADAPSVVVDSGNDEEDFLATMKIKLDMLRGMNSDIFGWIRIEGETGINYPLIFPYDNDRYLYYAADGSFNPAGSIFIDYRCDRDLKENRNLVIYGHNMEDGAPMFAKLHLYNVYPYFFVDNQYVVLYTDDKTYKYRIFACYNAEPVFREGCFFDVDFEDDAEFQVFIDGIIEKNSMRSGVTPTVADHILTLSTCSNNGVDRFIVQAVRVEDKDEG